jgi:hypothetical protein
VANQKGKRFVFNEKKGTFEEGRAQPALLREDLRKLPSEYLTNEVAEHDKVHEVDPPHIQEALLDDLREQEKGETPLPNAVDAVLQLSDCPLSQKVVPLNQWRVDGARLRVIFALIEKARQRQKKGKTINLEVQHLRFPEDNAHVYELKPGPPPPYKELRKHERGLKLWIDPFNWDMQLVEKLREAGIVFPDMKDEESQYRQYRLKLSEERIKRDEAP